MAEQYELGDIQNGGYILTEQKNTRLKLANNRYTLKNIVSQISSSPLKVRTSWSVEDVWDYESYVEQARTNKNLITSLLLVMNSSGSNVSLLLPDGLSQYLTVIGIADEFRYSSDW